MIQLETDGLRSNYPGICLRLPQHHPLQVGCRRPRQRPLTRSSLTITMTGSNWMFKKPVDESETQFRPRPSLPTSAYTSPRSVPKVPSITSSIRSVFSSPRKNKGPPPNPLRLSASASALSLPSGDLSDSSKITSTYSHPNSLNNDARNMPTASSRDVVDEEAECPVCLEPLSFSFRLPGEKPHIVPECGHALHEVHSSRSQFLRANRSHLISPRPVSPQSTVPHRVLQKPEWSGNPVSECVGYAVGQ